MVNRPEDCYVESRLLKRRFGIGTFDQKLNAECPLDETQLIFTADPDGRHYVCNACGTEYRFCDFSKEALEKQAEEKARSLQRALDYARQGRVNLAMPEKWNSMKKYPQDLNT
ncbi:MAG TPA: hypothetical protein VJG30_03530 [Candidatus Nanoarchaeia archaeon]|nr:hypothetical protein [Candidatus Nanoarchaeia archaeon]